MDAWLSLTIFYYLLIFTQLSSADLEGGSGDDSSVIPASRDETNFRLYHGPNQQEILRLLMMAAQSSRNLPHHLRGHTWGIPYRPVRRIGSEFLGKRSDVPPLYDTYDEDDNVEKRAMGSEFLGKRKMGSEFLGKRRMGSEFLGKRGMGSEFLGKRGMGSEFLGKRGMGSEFLGKRGMGSEFLGKRGMGSEFLGKRGMGSEFLGKRGMGSEFLGKRGMGSEFLGKRGMGSEFLGKRGTGSELPEKRRMGSEFLGKRKMGSEFLGKRNFDSDLDVDSQELPDNLLQNAAYAMKQQALEEGMSHIPEDTYSSTIGKRALGSEFLGKRKQGNAYEYSWKRGRLGSEFLGKRSIVPEQPLPYVQGESGDMDAPLSISNTNPQETKPNTDDLPVAK